MPLPFMKHRRTSTTPSIPKEAAAPDEKLPPLSPERLPPPPPPSAIDVANSPASFSLNTTSSALTANTNAALALIESGNWVEATELVRKNPEEAFKWASIKSKSRRNLNEGSQSSTTSARRLPLHHACLKLRSCCNKKAAADLISALLVAYPGAAKERETKHGCLPIHLAAFAISDNNKVPVTIASSSSNDITSFPNRNNNSNTAAATNSDEEICLSIIQDLLKVYPKACRETSEGGRLPLHMACAGRASPSIVRELLKHHGTEAARHRTKDGYLPLHLVALHGCSSEEVPILLLRKYPDAAVGRNKFDRIPLEEALFTAGENGRLKQEELVKVLRKHPSYWIQRPALMERRVVSEGAIVQPITAIGLKSLPQHFAGSSLHLLQEMRHTANNNSVYNNNNVVAKASHSLQSSNGSTTDCSELTSLIKAGEWEACKMRCSKRPNEAGERLTVQSRSGVTIKCTPLHYALELSAPLDVIQAIVNAATANKNSCIVLREKISPGGSLPLHVACTWRVSHDIISYLLHKYPDSSKQKDASGNLPLHQACFSGAPLKVVEALVRMWPDSTTVKNGSGSTPSDIVERLHHPNQDSVLSLLKKWREKVECKGGVEV
mmetsp:Transcript_7492/g.10874  ORF Transcript_7492/g.10874 Transcript_7492/m.10874 type:complete len:609 (-) Transcript_7492:124-1950(-)